MLRNESEKMGLGCLLVLVKGICDIELVGYFFVFVFGGFVWFI